MYLQKEIKLGIQLSTGTQSQVLTGQILATWSLRQWKTYKVLLMLLLKCFFACIVFAYAFIRSDKKEFIDILISIYWY